MDTEKLYIMILLGGTLDVNEFRSQIFEIGGIRYCDLVCDLVVNDKKANDSLNMMVVAVWEQWNISKNLMAIQRIDPAHIIYRVLQALHEL